MTHFVFIITLRPIDIQQKNKNEVIAKYMETYSVTVQTVFMANLARPRSFPRDTHFWPCSTQLDAWPPRMAMKFAISDGNAI